MRDPLTKTPKASSFTQSMLIYSQNNRETPKTKQPKEKQREKPERSKE